MGYFVAEGKSITTRRGVIGADDANPEITLADLGVDPSDAEAKKVAAGRLAELERAGYLIKAKAKPEPEPEPEAPPEPEAKPKSGKRGGATRAAGEPGAPAEG